ncbi:MAG: hypothetical protein SGJ19_10655 [Planctomycetia bacterium]|nr:hypothetical protein [Planctomycetia bacterium]
MAKKSRAAKSNAHRIETDPVVRAVQAAVNETLLDHKRSGHPVVFADEHGNPVWVPADEIVIPPLDEPKPKRRSKHNR